jgi:hypothetical protein
LFRLPNPQGEVAVRHARPLAAAVPLLGLSWLAISFPFIGSANAAAVPRVTYRSPVPGARWVTPETILALRFATAPDPGLLTTLRVEVTGTVSGAHATDVGLANDGRTLVIRPMVPFERGESVSGQVLVDGEPIPAPFTFTIASRRAPAVASPLEIGLPEPGAGARVGSAAPPAAPAGDYPEWSTTLYGPTSPGQLFLDVLGNTQPPNSWLMMTHEEGPPIFYRPLSSWTLDFKPQPDGTLTYYDYNGTQFEVLGSDFNVVRTITAKEGYGADGHELRILPNGDALYLIYDPQVVDMSDIVPGGDTAAVVSGLVIQEQDPSGDVVFDWRSWDHFQITDATHEDLTAHAIDYVHGNALEVDADGNLLLSCRHMDEITKIDRETGDVLWRWGGKNNQFSFVGDTLRFSHQHAIRRLANGHYTLFDNGNFRPTPYSRACEYVLDQQAHTAQLVWQFRNTPDTYSTAMGYVQRLDDGHTVIGWGTGTPAVTELDSTGTKVMDVTLPAGMVSYRAYRVDWGSNLVAAPRAGGGSRPWLALAGRSPCRGTERFEVDLPVAARVNLQAFDLSGRRVGTVLRDAPHAAGRFGVDLDVTGWRPGIYLCRLDAGSHVESLRLVVLL